MPLYDYQCPKCGVFEALRGISDKVIKCECGQDAKRIVGASPVCCFNDDGEWIRSVREVVDKDNKSPATQEFLKNPTRSNYKAWMKSEGIRHLEPGEKPINRPSFDTERHARKIMEYQQEQRRIEL